MRTRFHAGFVSAVALAIAGCYAVATHSWVIGSVEGGWIYNYVRPWTLGPVLVALAISAAAALLMRVRMEERGIGILLLAWVVFATAAHAALHASAPAGLEELYVSPDANSFYSLTQQQTASDLLARFNRVRLNSPLHARSNMPGKTIVTYGLELLSTNTAVLPWLVVILSNLGALLMFVFVRALFEDSRTALYAAVLYLFVPSRIVFFPLMNTITPIVVLACACLLMKWLRIGSTIMTVLFGVSLYGLVFFEPLPLVIGLLFAALSGFALYREWISIERFVLQCCLVLVTFIVVTEAVALATGFRLLFAFRQIQAHALAFNVIEARPYPVWIAANLGEFLFAAGVAQMLLFFAAPFADWPHPGSTWRDWLDRPITVTTIGLLAVLVATDLAGVNRGEVARLWIFLACLYQIPAAYVCARAPWSGPITIVVTLTMVHTAMATAMVRFVVP
ncbi:hypothetical protein BH18ACI5_BH18ACI5_28190 [soil metagenome]